LWGAHKKSRTGEKTHTHAGNKKASGPLKNREKKKIFPVNLKRGRRKIGTRRFAPEFHPRANIPEGNKISAREKNQGENHWGNFPKPNVQKRFPSNPLNWNQVNKKIG